MEVRLKVIYPYLTAALTVAILAVLSVSGDYDWPVGLIITFAIASTIAYRLDVRFPFAEITQGFAVSFTAIIVLGPVQAAVISGIGMAIASILMKKQLRRVVMNMSVQALACLAAGYVYYFFGGFGGEGLNAGIAEFRSNPIFQTAKYAFPVIVTGVVNSVINTSLLIPMFLLERHVRWGSLIRLSFWDAVATVMFLPLVFIVFVVYGGRELGNTIFTLIVLLAMWLVLKKIMELNLSRNTLAISLNQLKTIHEISKAINTTLDTRTILEIIAINGSPFLGLEAAAVRIFSKTPARDGGYDLVPDERWYEFLESKSFGHIMDHLRMEPATIVVPELTLTNIGRWFTPELIEKYEVRSFIAAPVLDGVRCVGTIMFFSRREQTFSPGQLEFVEYLANETSVAIKNARLYQDMHRTHQRQLEEIRIAERVQLGSLPKKFSSKDIFITGGIRPAMELSGDFFDVIETRPHLVAVVIGDVSGKGIPASLTMMAILNSVKVLAPKVSSPAEMMNLLNDSLFDESITMADTLQYSTGFYGVLDRQKLEMRYSVAGSEKPLWWHAKQKVLTFLEGEGRPLGMFLEYKYRNYKVKLEPGDRIILYTDGVIDAVNSEAERFSINRLLSTTERHCLREVKDLSAALFEDIHNWTGSMQLADDVAIYVVHINGRMGEIEESEQIDEPTSKEPEASLFDQPSGG